MGRLAKVGVVIGGYVAAVGAAILAGLFYDARVSKLPYDTSGGMYAGGEMLTSVAAFFVVALVPTLLALWFLRRNERFWDVVAILSIAFAAAGLASVVFIVTTCGASQHIASLVPELLGLAQLLGVPLWAMSFALFALIAPTQRASRNLLVALGIELVIGVCALLHWFVPGSRI